MKEECMIEVNKVIWIKGVAMYDDINKKIEVNNVKMETDMISKSRTELRIKS